MGLGISIGSITNKITSMFEKQALFDKDSRGIQKEGSNIG